MFPHLDVHNEPTSTSNERLSPARYAPHKSKIRFNLLTEDRKTPIDLTSRLRQPSKPMERLPQLSYGLLKDQALRKKLSDLGIPSHGPKPLLIKRHTEWINLVNANCDSSKPRTKRELLNELDIWERSQGRNILNGLGGNETSVMRKDFDGAAWATHHGNDFQQLIAKARRKPPAQREERIVDGVNGATNAVQSPHFTGSEAPATPKITGDTQTETDSTLLSPSNAANGILNSDVRSLEEMKLRTREPVIDLSGEPKSHLNSRHGLQTSNDPAHGG